MKSQFFTLLLIAILLSIKIYPQSLNIKWASRFGSSGWDYVSDFKESKSHDYYLCGCRKGTIPQDSSNLNPISSSNSWIIRTDSIGNIIWEKQFGSRSYDNVTSLVLDTSGIIVTGTYQDILYFGKDSLVSMKGASAYIAAFDTLGREKWIKEVGDGNQITNALIKSNNLGRKMIAGVFSDTLKMNDVQFPNTLAKGIFISDIQNDSLISNPNILLCHGNLSLKGIFLSDSIYCVTGIFSDTLFVSDSTVISYGKNDVFLAWFSYGGQLRRLLSFGGSENEIVNDILITESGESFIIGSFEGSALLNSTILQSNGGSDMFIACFDSTFKLKWEKTIGSPSDDIGYSITLNGSDEFFFSGNVSSDVIPDNNHGDPYEIQTYSVFGNSFIVKYNFDGNLKACFNLPCSSENYCKKMQCTAQGDITATGSFYEKMELVNSENTSNVSLISKGEKDIFLLAFKDICPDFHPKAGLDTVLCPGQTLMLNLDDTTLKWFWIPGGELSQPLNVSEPGTYHISMINKFGCIATDSVIVKAVLNPVAFAGNDSIVDPSFPVELLSAYSNNSTEYNWITSGNGYFSDNSVLNPDYSMSYDDISNGSTMLTLIANNNCSADSSEVLISVPFDENGIIAYPNPTSGLLSIVCKEGFLIQNISISSQFGETILPYTQVDNEYFSYDFANLSPGSYIIQVTCNNLVESKIINKL